MKGIQSRANDKMLKGQNPSNAFGNAGRPRSEQGAIDIANNLFYKKNTKEYKIAMIKVAMRRMSIRQQAEAEKGEK